MTTTYILGDNVPRKSKFDPHLAEKLTKYYEEHPEALNEKPEVPPAPTLPVNNISGPLELIDANYLTTIQAAVPETIQTSAELQKARVEFNSRGDTSLNTLGFYTANVPLYGVENGKPFLLFGRREAFLRLYVPNIEEVNRQILDSPNNVYTLPNIDKAWAMKEGISSSALKRFDLAELVETRTNRGGFFEVDTKKVAQLKGAKRELAELIHGQGNDYFKSMKMLADNGISNTRILFLNPSYISSIAGSNLIGRVSYLSYFVDVSNFDADALHVECKNYLRGVRKK